jgi:hypothetical protein
MSAAKVNILLVTLSKTEVLCRVNNVYSYTFDNQRAALSAHAEVNILVAITTDNTNDTLVSQSCKLASMERQ